jgi:hypothetical protein
MPYVKSSLKNETARQTAAKHGKKKAAHLKKALSNKMVKSGKSVPKGTEGYEKVIMQDFQKKTILQRILALQDANPQKRTTAQKKAKRSPSPFTDTINIAAIKQAGSVAAKEAMALMGYAIIAHEGWIVKKYPDGKMEQLHKI